MSSIVMWSLSGWVKRTTSKACKMSLPWRLVATWATRGCMWPVVPSGSSYLLAFWVMNAWVLPHMPRSWGPEISFQSHGISCCLKIVLSASVSIRHLNGLLSILMVNFGWALGRLRRVWAVAELAWRMTKTAKRIEEGGLVTGKQSPGHGYPSRICFYPFGCGVSSASSSPSSVLDLPGLVHNRCLPYMP